MKRLYAIAAALILCISFFTYDHDVPSNIISINYWDENYEDSGITHIGWPISIKQASDDFLAVHFVEYTGTKFVEKIGLIHRLNFAFFVSQEAAKNRNNIIEITEITEFYSADDIVESIKDKFGENILNEEYVYSPENQHAPAYVITIKEHPLTE